MKIILRILLTLTISIIVLYGSHSSETNTFSRSVKVLAQRPTSLPPIAQNLANHLFPTDDGYIDRTGKVVFKIPIGSGNGGAFSDGLAAITFKSGLIGYLDHSGKIVIPPKFRDSQVLDGSENFSEGLAAFTSPSVDIQGRDLFGYIDKLGKIAIPAKFTKVGKFHDGRALIEINTGNFVKFAFINKQGKIIFEHPQAYEALDFSEGLAAVNINDKWGFIDRGGKFVIPPKFVNIGQYAMFMDGLAPVRGEAKYTYQCESNPVKTQIGHTYKYGYIDKTGKYQIEPKFDEARNFSEEGVAAVRIDTNISVGKWGYIDRTGSFVIPPKFADTTFGVSEFREGLASINVPDLQSVNGKTGYIDRTGNFVIPPQFTQGVGIFHGGLAYVTTALMGASDPQIKLSDGSSMHSNIKYGFIDRQGKFVWAKILTVGR